MTNEQLTQKFIELAEHQAKYEATCIAEKEQIQSSIEDMKKEIRTFKTLAEDVHIMAINMSNIQKEQTEIKETTTKQLEDINKKINALTSQEFIEYKENKKILKKNIISAIGGALGTGIIGVIIWFMNKFMNGGV